ncbi:MAG: hypothetical protein ACOZCE_03575 [Spirochaetota bacterium]|jgi:hypothetical protein
MTRGHSKAYFLTVVFSLFWGTFVFGAQEQDVIKSMESLMQASQDAFDTNHPVEALKHLVGILALNDEAAPETNANRKSQRSELVRKADQKLTEIGARLTLEAGDEWIKEDGTQRAGNVRDLAKGSGLMPVVRLVVNYDFGKAVVADAPIRFAFVDGIGDITLSSTTDANGLASTVVRSLNRTDKPVLIRAMLVISNRGKTRAFPEVHRDFAYVLPARTARIFASEGPASSQSGATAASPAPKTGAASLVDSISRALNGTGLDLLPTDSALDPKTFAAALQGDLGAIQRACNVGGTTISYLVLADVQYDEPRQMVLNGKTYNIFTSTARAQIRIVRSNGTVAITRPTISVKGQGGTEAAAIQSALMEARKAVEQDLSANVGEIKSALD